MIKTNGDKYLGEYEPLLNHVVVSLLDLRFIFEALLSNYTNAPYIFFFFFSRGFTMVSISLGWCRIHIEQYMSSMSILNPDSEPDL